MPKYHFEIIDQFRLEDPVGADCPDDAQAKREAHKIARQLAIDITSEEDRAVVVVDEDGNQVYQADIKGQIG